MILCQQTKHFLKTFFIILILCINAESCFSQKQLDTSALQVQRMDTTIVPTSGNHQIIIVKETAQSADKQHDWLFYFFNIIITSILTLLMNYLNSKFEIIKLQTEPSVDRLKTIAIEGIKTEKKIYTDLKLAQEHLSYGRKQDANEVITSTSNYLEENKMDIKPALYSYATDIISYITLVVQGKETRSEQNESQLFEAYYKEYRK